MRGSRAGSCPKARATRRAGCQKQLDAIVTPFVYRRYLDFGVISAIRALHLQIRQEAQRRASMRPDKADDIKLGRGGIREIEFSAQVFQLIRGGQDAGFRVRPTLAVLRHAATHGLLDTSVCVKLSQAYRFLRELEHRLQYRNDAQTHAMPVDPEERAALAHAMGFDDYAALMPKLDAHREFVEQQFDQIFADKVSGRDGCGAPEDGAAVWVWSSALADDSADEALAGAPVELGVAEPDELLARCVRYGSRRVTRGSPSVAASASISSRSVRWKPRVRWSRPSGAAIRWRVSSTCSKP